ncbi:Os03g0828901 [Oryza sativa Japonica Group]|uniref:Os03g0828000 protein n=1 Tax=Oryza sativa subsp. japonica TaxID=39947 RepID=A0A0P0W5Y5_ORYSJ|nr:Os03g0828000 [Oryza sativa Japonica Group]BAS87179.1 Os03g0828901 [Oryza sativa Japonica Group]
MSSRVSPEASRWMISSSPMQGPFVVSMNSSPPPATSIVGAHGNGSSFIRYLMYCSVVAVSNSTPKLSSIGADSNASRSNSGRIAGCSLPASSCRGRALGGASG